MRFGTDRVPFAAFLLTAIHRPVNSAMPKPVRVYTTTYCPFCDRAKELLRRRGITFEVIDVTEDSATRDWLVATTGRRSVPQIFVGEQPIGGYEDLRALDDAGRLDALLAD